MQEPQNQNNGAFAWMARHPLYVIGAAVLITAILSVPFLTMAPTTSASQEPGGAVFDARDAVEDQFVSAVFDIPIIVESRDGNLLTRESLIELLGNAAALRAEPQLGSTLLTYYDPTTASDVVGVRTIADFVDARLPSGLEPASDAEVDAAVAAIIEEAGPESDALGLSADTRFDADTGRWIAPALLTAVLADNDMLGFTDGGVTLGSDTAPEEYSRDVAAVIRGDERTFQAWGVAIDVNLTSQEQGAAAGPFIGFTILAVLVIVGIVFRSYWALAITGASLGALIIWLYGISNLIGLENDMILSLIVPIAMISFGVDFAFHSLGRYREERRLGYAPRRAFSVGMAAVIGALVLALLSDTAAFLANASSGIESLIQFGIATSIALVAAFLLLGIVTPLAFATIEERVGTPPRSRTRTVGRVAAQTGAGLFAMTTVLLMVYLSPPAGVAALAIYIGVALVAPVMLSRRRPTESDIAEGGGVGRVAALVGTVVAWFASKRSIVLPVAGAITITAGFLAVQVPTEFDVKDFFTADSDFVVALDKVDEHFAERGGEPATIYVEADLTDPVVVDRLARFRDDVIALDASSLARAADGRTFVDRSVLQVIEDAWASPITIQAISRTQGVTLSDVDGDGIPDDAAQLATLYAYTRRAGIAVDSTRFLRTPNDVQQRIWISDDGTTTATTFIIGMTNTRRQESIVEAREAVDPLIAGLRADLQATDDNAVVQLTGGPIVRQESLDAVSRALQVSLPIAVVLCFLIAAAFMRSIRFAAVSVIPILITVALLYAFMEVAGYSINIVTATIGAVSIGIGIDFAIHLTMRYREELDRSSSRDMAMRRTGEGTGIALLSSAVSSAVGFFILAFAPMPMFASYGLLTAVMITMAAAATLLVLPSLLVMVTREPSHSIPDEEPQPETELATV
ncbi:MAG: RND family transporter [Acidimicrobiia bacterium]